MTLSSSLPTLRALLGGAVCALLAMARLEAGPSDVLSYAGAGGKTRFHCVLELSDGSLLVGGEAANLDWVPTGVTRKVLADPTGGWSLPAASGTHAQRQGILLHLKSDLSLDQVLSFPLGKGGAIKAIKATNVPGATSGSLYLSGEYDDAKNYWIAKLNGNFVSGSPTGLAWGFNKGSDSAAWISCANYGGIGHDALWDVGGDGKAIFYYYKGNDWGSVHRLKADGTGLDPVPGWWDVGAGGVNGISLKPSNGNLRSTSAQDYHRVSSHGGPTAKSKKQGAFPYDYYYSSHKGDAASKDGGYTGYSSDGKAANTFAVHVDRRSNAIYLGFCNGNPQNTHDFEAMLVAYDKDGAQAWYSRMKDEWVDANDNGLVDSGETQQSPPDQYCDGITVDYTKPVDAAEVLVLARSHGNAAWNFWSGASGGNSFHNGFTGTNGNEHLSWLGRFKGGDGSFVDATWIAEYDPWGSNFGAAYADPNLDGWPDHNKGWANLKTTKAHGLVVDALGRACIFGTGRGPLTTANAFQKMPIPNASHSNGYGPWADFLRMHSADFSTLAYSTALTDSFASKDGSGGNTARISGLWPTSRGMLVVGYQDTKGTVGEGSLPTQNPLAWGSALTNASTTVADPVAFLARLDVGGGAAPPSYDLNQDQHVDLKDLARLAASFGKRKGESGYQAVFDLNSDGVIDEQDVTLLFTHLD